MCHRAWYAAIVPAAAHETRDSEYTFSPPTLPVTPDTICQPGIHIILNYMDAYIMGLYNGI
jgi:hypothetical protein